MMLSRQTAVSLGDTATAQTGQVGTAPTGSIDASAASMLDSLFSIIFAPPNMLGIKQKVAGDIRPFLVSAGIWLGAGYWILGSQRTSQ